MNQRIVLLLALIVLAGAALLLRPKAPSPTVTRPVEKSRPATTKRMEEPAPFPRWSPGDPVTEEIMANYKHFKLRPFAVTASSDRYEWTGEDGMKSAAVNELAHNPIERHRLIEENTFVLKRQLIYTKKNLGEVARDSRESGNKLESYTLPGFDGHEMKVLIDDEEHDEGGGSGSYYGRLDGREESMVVLTYQEDRESYIVISREDGINYEYLPREAGEIVLRSIDPVAPRGNNHDCAPQTPFKTGP